MADEYIGRIGLILGAFIGVIIGLVIYQGAISQQIGQVTNEVTVNPTTITAPAANVSYTLQGQSTRSFVARNGSGETLTAGNYTLRNYQVSDGNLIATVTPTDSKYAGTSWNISYIYEPQGYITSAGGRSVTGLIAIFLVLAIAFIALVPTLREKILG